MWPPASCVWNGVRTAPGDVHPLSFTVPEIDALPAGAEAMFTFTDYPTVDINDPEAILTVRTSPDAEATTIPRENWRFTDETHWRWTAVSSPSTGMSWSTGPRWPRSPAADCWRSATSCRTCGADGIDHTFAYGVSQAGRLLRQFLSDGLNVDESGMTVFDGVFSDFASAARGEFNHRYAQPSVAQAAASGHTAPSRHR